MDLDLGKTTHLTLFWFTSAQCSQRLALRRVEITLLTQLAWPPLLADQRLCLPNAPIEKAASRTSCLIIRDDYARTGKKRDRGITLEGNLRVFRAPLSASQTGPVARSPDRYLRFAATIPRPANAMLSNANVLPPSGRTGGVPTANAT